MIVAPVLPLSGKTVLVTRPDRQSGRLCSLIEENGGTAVRLPTIEIRPPQDPAPVLEICRRLGDFQIAIFVSRNAVEQVFETFLSENGIPGGLSVMAIGAGTASQIRCHGVKIVSHLSGTANSEEFLELDELQPEAIRGKRVIIFRGQGGRELLADVLRKRGATVEYAEVYQRVVPQYDEDMIHSIWTGNRPDVMVVTSNEGLQNLITITAPGDREYLLDTPLVVIGTRTSELATELGFRRMPVIARETSDQGLLDTVIATVGTGNL